MEKKRAELIQRLRAMIASGEGFSGGKLPSERELAASLSVSRNLLREAIVSLEALGVLEVRDRQGAYVMNPSGEAFSASLRFASLLPADMLINLMEMRLVIEAPIAALAARRRTEAELQGMRSCLRRLEEVAGSPDGGASSGGQWDSLLHKLVVDAAHNPLLSRLYEGLAATMERHIAASRELLLGREGWSERILAEHGALVDAIAAGEASAAEIAQRRHLEAALAQLRALDQG